MNDTKPQTADGKVLRHFRISLDGFVAGPNQMDWMTGFTSRPGLINEYVETTGAEAVSRSTSTKSTKAATPRWP